MTKKELRNIYKFKRKSLSKIQLTEFSQQIFENLKQMNIWDYQTYHIFYPIENQNEIRTKPIIDYLFSTNKTVVVPKIENKNLLVCEISPSTVWRTTKFGIPEPLAATILPTSKIDVVFLPMLICDEKGNRIGYGGGFYDQFLKNCNTETILIGLSYFQPINYISDVEDWDIPINYCVTPDEIVSFNSKKGTFNSVK